MHKLYRCKMHKLQRRYIHNKYRTGEAKMTPSCSWGHLMLQLQLCPLWHNEWINYFIHSNGTCGMRRFLAVLRNSFHYSLLCSFSCHPSPPTTLPSFLTSSCHLFLGLPLELVVPRFIYNTTLLGIVFSSVLCACPNQRNLFKWHNECEKQIRKMWKGLSSLVRFSSSSCFTWPH